MAVPVTFGMPFGDMCNEKHRLVDIEELLRGISPDIYDQYKECFLANFGGMPTIQTLQRRLNFSALSKMGVEDFAHQKTIMKHVRALGTSTRGATSLGVQEETSSLTPDTSETSETSTSQQLMTPPMESQSAAAAQDLEGTVGPESEAALPETPAAEGESAAGGDEAALSIAWAPAAAVGGNSSQVVTPVINVLSDEELRQLHRCMSGNSLNSSPLYGAAAGFGMGNEQDGYGAAVRGGTNNYHTPNINGTHRQSIPLRSVLNKDKDTEKRMRSMWDHIKTLQKELDEDVRHKRSEKIDKIRNGLLSTEEDVASNKGSLLVHGAQAGGVQRAAGTGAGLSHPPHPASEVGRRGSSSASSSSTSTDHAVRSLNYGNCALRMGLIEKHLLSVQNRIVEGVRKIIGCERASLMFVDIINCELFFFVGDTLIRIPSDKGIAGLTVQTGEVLRVEDAYSDPRFNPHVDRETGFHTTSILSFPVRQRHGGRVVAVIQMLNKDRGFNTEDVSAVESCSMEVADELEECMDTLATATAQWDKYRCSTMPKVAGHQRRAKPYLPENLVEAHAKRLGSHKKLGTMEWLNGAWTNTSKARVEESIRLKRRTEYGRAVVKNQYGL